MRVSSLAHVTGPVVLIFFRGLWRPGRRDLGDQTRAGVQAREVGVPAAHRLRSALGRRPGVDRELGSRRGLDPTVPHPTAVIARADGAVRTFRSDVASKPRSTAGMLLEALGGIG